MKKFYILSIALAMACTLGSCRDTEMNTDGNMEEHETREGELQSES